MSGLAYINLINSIVKKKAGNVAAWIFYGADPDGDSEETRGEPLRVALVSKKCYETLLANGANPSLSNNLPLADAADQQKSWAIKKLVAKGADINARNLYVLEKFGLAGDIKTVKWIMNNGGIVTRAIYQKIRDAGKTQVAGYLYGFL